MAMQSLLLAVFHGASASRIMSSWDSHGTRTSSFLDPISGQEPVQKMTENPKHELRIQRGISAVADEGGEGENNHLVVTEDATDDGMAPELGRRRRRSVDFDGAERTVDNLPTDAEGNGTEHSLPIEGEDVRAEQLQGEVSSRPDSQQTELSVAQGQPNIVIAVASEGETMKFREPESKQLLEVTVPKGVYPGMSFVAFVLQPKRKTEKAQILSVQKLDKDLVLISKPMTATKATPMAKLTFGNPENGTGLIPNLVPRLGSAMSWDLTEDEAFGDNPLIPAGKEWRFDDAGLGLVLSFRCSHSSLYYGHSVVKVYDSVDNQLFSMRTPKNGWKMFRWRYILVAQNSTKPLFTIIKPVISAGPWMNKERWFIYRGGHAHHKKPKEANKSVNSSNTNGSRKSKTSRHSLRKSLIARKASRSWVTPDLVYMCESEQIIVGHPKVMRCFASLDEYKTVRRQRKAVQEEFEKRRNEGEPWKNKSSDEKKRIADWKMQEDEAVENMLKNITIAELKQKMNIGAYLNPVETYVPDEYTLTVNGGGDAALFMAWSVLVDIKDDWEPKREYVKNNLILLGLSKLIAPYWAAR